MLDLQGNRISRLNGPVIQPDAQAIPFQALGKSVDDLPVFGAVAEKNIIFEFTFHYIVAFVSAPQILPCALFTFLVKMLAVLEIDFLISLEYEK
jgi:hypothetical protein